MKGIASETPDAPDAASELKTRVEAVQQLRRQLTSARAKFKPDSPEVSALEKQLASARALMMQPIAGAAPENDDAELRRIDGLPTQARARVADFWGGVYKQFALRGPATFLLQSSAQPLQRHHDGRRDARRFAQPERWRDDGDRAFALDERR